MWQRIDRDDVTRVQKGIANQVMSQIVKLLGAR
jgi:hypothetical protein